MREETFTFKSKDDLDIFVYKWLPEREVSFKGVLQIAHGMAEHAARYKDFAEFMAEQGYIVYANDHRGHGKTAGSIDNIGYLADSSGFERLVHDMYQLTLLIKKDWPDLAIFLLGHSMGSFALQYYLTIYSNQIDGAILSGSNGKMASVAMAAAQSITTLTEKAHDRKYISPKLNEFFFGSYTKEIDNPRTAQDWLSRDPKVVNDYIDDPMSGTPFSVGFYQDLLQGFKVIGDADNIGRVRKDLPIYIFSGDADPVGNYGKGVQALRDAYRQAGISNLELKLYPGGRHEMLNEINRQEVYQDVANWLDQQLDH